MKYVVLKFYTMMTNLRIALYEINLRIAEFFTFEMADVVTLETM